MNPIHTLNLSAIVAMSDNRVIGHHNQVPWHLPTDIKRFKELSIDQSVLMGRKTYQSIGHPLANRINIILTRDPYFKAPTCYIAHSIQAALAYAMEHHYLNLFVIGGAEIYTQTLSQLKYLYLTIIHHTLPGDAYFPEIDYLAWDVLSEKRYPADSTHAYSYSFLHLQKAARCEPCLKKSL